MRVLVGCEWTGTVRRAFAAHGHDAWSCDLLPAEDGSSNHIVGDVLNVLDAGWDLAVFHPPCTHMTLAGARWFYDPRFPNKAADRDAAIAFWLKLRAAPIERTAFENPQPLGYVTERVGCYDQKVQPWEFHDNETKGVCLWLKNLPRLEPLVRERPTNVRARVHHMAPGPDRAKERSRFFPGIAAAMAATWAPQQLAVAA